MEDKVQSVEKGAIISGSFLAQKDKAVNTRLTGSSIIWLLYEIIEKLLRAFADLSFQPNVSKSVRMRAGNEHPKRAKHN